MTSSPPTHPLPTLQVHVQLHSHPQQMALSVYPDASIYEQLQLNLKHAGLVVSAHFGGEPLQRSDRFEDWGMEGGATIAVVVENIAGLSADPESVPRMCNEVLIPR